MDKTDKIYLIGKTDTKNSIQDIMNEVDKRISEKKLIKSEKVIMKELAEMISDEMSKYQS